MTAPLPTATAIKRLGNYGINAQAYARPPGRKGLFWVGRSGRADKIHLWVPEHVEPQVIGGSKKRKQVVLNVQEPDRTITANVSLAAWSHHDFDNRPDRRGILLREFERSASFNVPEGAEVVNDQYVRYRDGAYIYSTEIHIPETNTFFLMGVDEECHFICQLPREVTSYQDALDSLRPSYVPSGAKRQGEWFFLPVTPEMRVWLDFQRPCKARDEAWDYPPFQVRQVMGDHRPTECVYSGDRGTISLLLATIPEMDPAALLPDADLISRFLVFVKGSITNPRHKTLKLRDWHVAIRNLEVEQDNSSRQRWD